mmetsp:Transcript_69567/g.193582  ORF Transcript_69567/g.193582 Transcript_69567/m.193582 type:complete len:157 (+) Transcript_69567:106-576(+)
MSPPAVPKVAIAPERWTATVYSTPDASLAKAEVSSLTAMQFDGAHWSKAFRQCIGRGLSHQECAAALPDDTRVTPPGPLASVPASSGMTSAIGCMSETGDSGKCGEHFASLAKLAGHEEPVKEGMSQKASDFCSKAGYKLLGVPVLFYGLKFIKIR